MDFNQVMWGSKKFSDLLKDIYTNSKEKEKQIKELIDTLKPLVTNSSNTRLRNIILNASRISFIFVS
jgi:archaellum biogenesis ATPase FlaH